MRHIHFLNLDIVAGVAAGGLLVQRSCGVELPWAWWIVVPCTAWIVYTLDRVFDDDRQKGSYPTLRHQFHHVHRTKLLSVAAFIGCCVLAIAYIFLPWWSWIVGAIGALFVGLHHWAQRRMGRKLSGVVKDLNVVVTYTLALWAFGLIGYYLGNATEQSIPFTSVIISLAIHVAIVAAMVLQLSIADMHVDESLHQPSIALSIGRTGAGWLFRLLLGVAGVLSVVLLGTDTGLACVYGGMIVYTAFLPRVFSMKLPMPISRLITESILSLPVLLLLI